VEPEIVTSRLELSPLVASDAQAMYEYRSAPEVCQYQSFEPRSLVTMVAHRGTITWYTWFWVRQPAWNPCRTPRCFWSAYHICDKSDDHF